MALIIDLALQGVQMVLVVAIAPAILGVTRKVKEIGRASCRERV